MPAVWVYSNWITFPTGSATRLSALRSHIQEISDYLRDQIAQYSIPGREVDPRVGDLRALLGDLMKTEALEAERAGVADGSRLPWTRGRAIL